MLLMVKKNLLENPTLSLLEWKPNIQKRKIKTAQLLLERAFRSDMRIQKQRTFGIEFVKFAMMTIDCAEHTAGNNEPLYTVKSSVL